MSHTPTPWRMDYGELNIICPEGNFVAKCGESVFIDPDEQEDNARFIVRACNVHDELVDALDVVIDCVRNGWPPDDRQLAIIHAASAKAKGEPTA